MTMNAEYNVKPRPRPHRFCMTAICGTSRRVSVYGARRHDI